MCTENVDPQSHAREIIISGHSKTRPCRRFAKRCECHFFPSLRWRMGRQVYNGQTLIIAPAATKMLLGSLSPDQDSSDMTAMRAGGSESRTGQESLRYSARGRPVRSDCTVAKCSISLPRAAVQRCSGQVGHSSSVRSPHGAISLQLLRSNNVFFFFSRGRRPWEIWLTLCRIAAGGFRA